MAETIHLDSTEMSVEQKQHELYLLQQQHIHQQQHMQQLQMQQPYVAPPLHPGYVGFDESLQDAFVPQQSQVFVDELCRAVENRDVVAMKRVYTLLYNKTSQEVFKTSRWPEWKHFSDRTQNVLIQCLYKEMAHRHIFSNTKLNNPTIDERKESWENYCTLFEYLIQKDFANPSHPGDMQLPNQMLWDILDEFVYQYGTYSQFRMKMIKSTQEADVVTINDPEFQDVWHSVKVLKYLKALSDKSCVEKGYLIPLRNHMHKELEQVVEGAEHAPKGVSEEEMANWAHHPCDVTKMLGYFALVQQLRLHCMMGDYYMALKSVQHLVISYGGELNVPCLYFKVPACHVSLMYYLGFCYMMMRRFSDAINVFSDILIFVSKASRIVPQTAYIYEKFHAKTNEKMYNLLLICLSLCPQKIDDTLEYVIHSKKEYNDRKLILGKQDETTIQLIEELFVGSCPKFVACSMGPDASKNEINECQMRQAKLFMKYVTQRKALPKIEGFMRLYTAISVDKLAKFSGMSSETLRINLLALKNRNTQVLRDLDPATLYASGPLDGKLRTVGQVDYMVDSELITVEVAQKTVPYTSVFLKQISHFQDMLSSLQGK